MPSRDIMFAVAAKSLSHNDFPHRASGPLSQPSKGPCLDVGPCIWASIVARMSDQACIRLVPHGLQNFCMHACNIVARWSGPVPGWAAYYGCRGIFSYPLIFYITHVAWCVRFASAFCPGRSGARCCAEPVLGCCVPYHVPQD